METKWSSWTLSQARFFAEPAMTMDKALKILALVTLVEMMIYVGLSASVRDVAETVKNWSLVARGIFANYVLFPALTIGLLLLFQAQPLVAVGFMILAVCPAGPYGAAYTAIAKGNVGVAAGLMIILVGLSSLFSPALLHVLVPLVSGSELTKVNVSKIVVTLLLGQMLPLLTGLAVHHWRPRLAARLVGPAEKGAKILNTAFLLLVLYAQFKSLLAIRLLGLLGMLILLVTSIAIGWLAGGPGNENRKSMALTTAVRNNGVGMVIATGSFAGTPAVTATVVYGTVGVLGALVFAVRWGRRASAQNAIRGGAQI
jgi:BASS family bile acid:Na+ symporter